MRKKLLKHDLEFVIVVALLSVILTSSGSYGFDGTSSLLLVSALFLGYMAYSGHKLFSLE